MTIMSYPDPGHEMCTGTGPQITFWVFWKILFLYLSVLCRSEFSSDFFLNWLKQASHKLRWMNLLAKSISYYLLPFRVGSEGGGSLNRDPKKCLGNAILYNYNYV